MRDRDWIFVGSGPLSIRDIVLAVAAHFGVSERSLRGPMRRKKYTLPRHIVFYLAREHTKLSYPAIGEDFGLHHTSVMYGERRIKRLLGKNNCSAECAEKRDRIAEAINRIRATLHATLGRAA